MKHSIPVILARLVTLFFFTLFTINASSQGLLHKNISLQIGNQKLGDVLEIVSNQGNFYFSYHSGIIRTDSIVSLSVTNRSIRDVLDLLFKEKFEFRESGKYVIIRRKPVQLTLVTNKAVVADKSYTVTGYVSEDQTGMRIRYASVYERSSLASALTDDDGHFSLKLKSKSRIAFLTISKELYEDTTVQIETRHNQQLNITIIPLEYPESQVIITPEDYLSPERKPDSLPNIRVGADTVKVEATAFGNLMIPARQKWQSINLRKFFTQRPFQVSLTPGLSTHGKLSGQVMNHVSLNVFGGYTAGTNGIEIGGLFNINKKTVKYFQAAGILNIAGGNVSGFQVAGVSNTVLDSVTGFQAGGVNNFVKGNLTGFQTGGVYNHVAGDVFGVQVAGVGNFVRGSARAVQVSGVANITAKTIKGVQVSGVINYAKHLKGVQIGLINIADSSDGFSIGLVNIILKGYHKLSISTNEVLMFNAQFKTGNQKFYSILHAGARPVENKKLYGFGYGMGSDIAINRKKSIFINPEIVSQYLYTGSWDHMNLLSRFQLNLNIKITKMFSLYAGPSYSVFYSDQHTSVPGYLYPITTRGYKITQFSYRVSGWIGFNCGINLF